MNYISVEPIWQNKNELVLVIAIAFLAKERAVWREIVLVIVLPSKECMV